MLTMSPCTTALKKVEMEVTEVVASPHSPWCLTSLNRFKDVERAVALNRSIAESKATQLDGFVSSFVITSEYKSNATGTKSRHIFPKLTRSSKPFLPTQHV